MGLITVYIQFFLTNIYLSIQSRRGKAANSFISELYNGPFIRKLFGFVPIIFYSFSNP